MTTVTPQAPTLESGGLLIGTGRQSSVREGPESALSGPHQRAGVGISSRGLVSLGEGCSSAMLCSFYSGHMKTIVPLDVATRTAVGV